MRQTFSYYNSPVKIDKTDSPLYANLAERGLRGCDHRESKLLPPDKRTLELHHPDPANKSFNLAQAAAYTVPEVLAELEKVECLCVRCHRIETWKQVQHPEISRFATASAYKGGKPSTAGFARRADRSTATATRLKQWGIVITGYAWKH